MCSCTGDFKTTLADAFNKFRAKAVKRREEMKKVKEEAERLEGQEDGDAGTLAAAPATASTAGGGSAAAMTDDATQVLKHPGWPGVFNEEVITWLKDQVKEGGPKASYEPKLRNALANLEGSVSNWSYKSVLMSPKDPPEGNVAWVANVTLKGGTSGSQVFELLSEVLVPLYRNLNAQRKSVPAEFACRADESRFDRPLTAQIAWHAGMAPRLKENKKTEKVTVSKKRRSPEPERAGSRHKR